MWHHRGGSVRGGGGQGRSLMQGVESLELFLQGRNLHEELRNNARGVSGGNGQRLGGRSRWWGGPARPWAGLLSMQVHQHVVLVEFDIAGQNPASLWVECLRCQLGLECMENRDYPMDSLGTVLWTRGRDSGDSKRLASIGAGFCGPGPVKWVGIKVVKYRTRDCRQGKLSFEGVFGEGVIALSYL